MWSQGGNIFDLAAHPRRVEFIVDQTMMNECQWDLKRRLLGLVEPPGVALEEGNRVERG